MTFFSKKVDLWLITCQDKILWKDAAILLSLLVKYASWETKEVKKGHKTEGKMERKKTRKKKMGRVQTLKK